MTVENVLVPTDGSTVAEDAANRAFDLATQFDARVHLLAVVDSNVVASASYTGESPNVRHRLREKANTWVSRLSSEASGRGLETIEAIEEGVPAERIVDYAEENDVDMIAMGTHGRGGFQRFVLGSTTDEVIRSASTPVVTVRPADAKAGTESRGSEDE